MNEQRTVLTIRREGAQDTQVALPLGKLRIGRAENNELLLPALAVSRRHARLEVTPTGVRLVDTGSGNGTWMHGARILEHEILDGDIVHIGPFELHFSVPEPRMVTEPLPVPVMPLAPLAAQPPAVSAPPPAAGAFGRTEMEVMPPAPARPGRGRRLLAIAGALAVAALALLVVGIALRGATPEDDHTPPTVPEDPEVVRLLQEGNGYFAQRDYIEAIRRYTAVQQRHPANATATKMGYHACEFMVAQALYDTIVQRAAGDSERSQAREEALASAERVLAGGRGVNAAIGSIEASLQLHPGDTGLLEARGKLEAEGRRRVRRGHANQREKHLEQVTGLYEQAVDTLRNGDDLRAYGQLEQVLAADPDKLTELYWRAEETMRSIESERARQGSASFRAAVSAKRGGDFLTARDQLRETLRVNPFHSSAERHLHEVQAKLDGQALRLWSEAEVYEQTNQVEMAAGRYHQVIEHCASASSPLARKAQARLDALVR